jgi:hypothetical protein
MKRKVKKFAEGGTNVRTRTDDEFAEDSKFGGYGRYMPKTKSITLGGKSSAEEDRPKSSGVEDYATLGKRAGATSPFSGPKEYISESVKEESIKEPETDTEEPRRKISDYISTSSAKEDVKPAVKKKVAAKTESKRGSQSFPIKGEVSGSQSFPIRGSSDAKPSSALTRAGTEARTPDVMGTARTRAGTVVSGRQEANKEDVAKSMSSLADRIRKQDQENSFSFKATKSPNRSYKSGGKVSSASSRGDGIAQRGKTKGRMC